MPSFSAIAEKKLSDVIKAPLPPAGHWKFIVNRMPEFRKQGIYEVWDFPSQAVEAAMTPEGRVIDVDADTIARYGDVKKINLRKSFMFNTEDAIAFQQTENNLKRFLIEHLKCADDTVGLKQAISMSLNCPYIGEIKWTPDKENEGEFFANIGKTAPLTKKA